MNEAEEEVDRAEMFEAMKGAAADDIHTVTDGSENERMDEHQFIPMPADNSLDDVMHPDGTLRSCFASTDSEIDEEPATVTQGEGEATPRLLPCPFCGLHPTENDKGTFKKSNFSPMVELRHWCGDKARLIQITLPTAERVARIWNTRPSQPAYEAVEKALRKSAAYIHVSDRHRQSFRDCTEVSCTDARTVLALVDEVEGIGNEQV